jgi:HEAT repeats
MIGILVVVGLLTAAVAVELASRSEPRYQGERLSVWLRAWYGPPKPGSGPAAFQEFARKRRETEAAVRNLGGKAVPYLTHMLQARDSALKTRALQYGWVQWLATRSRFTDFLEPAWRKNRTAAQALSLLGPGAKAAVPALIETLARNPDEETRRCAAVCLGTIGPDAAAAVPELTWVSIIGSGFLRLPAREALRSIGLARTNGLVVALQYEHSQNSAIQSATSVTLDVVDPGRIYGMKAEPAGAANRSQPVEPRTSRTSPAAGCGR